MSNFSKTFPHLGEMFLYLETIISEIMFFQEFNYCY